MRRIRDTDCWVRPVRREISVRLMMPASRIVSMITASLNEPRSYWFAPDLVGSSSTADSLSGETIADLLVSYFPR
jgi:hypothetical protein